MTRTNLIPAILAAGIAIATTAVAADKPTPEQVAEYQRKLFKYLDADNDGKLTRNEFVVTALYDAYVKQDLDRDGKLTKEEFVKSFKEESDVETEWAMMDSDNDGLITFKDVFKNKIAVSEMETAFRTELDRSGRGYVTLAEIQTQGE